MAHYHQSPDYALDQTDTHIAIDEFLTFLDNYPYSGFADSAVTHLSEMREKLALKNFKAARMYQKMNFYDPAILYYDHVLENYPQSSYSAEALYRKGECLIKLEKYLEARDSFLLYIEEYKDHKYYDDAVAKLREIEDLPKVER
jgi:outer membrane assembly lipoprotein YfiO